MVIQVVELVVMPRMTVRVWALAVAFCDVELVAPVKRLIYLRWPRRRRQEGPVLGKQTGKEDGDHGEGDGLHLWDFCLLASERGDWMRAMDETSVLNDYDAQFWKMV